MKICDRTAAEAKVAGNVAKIEVVGKEGVKGSTAEEINQGIKEISNVNKLSVQKRKAIQSLENQIALHEKKLKDFIENPTVKPGMENLPKEMIQKQQERRIQHLKQEISTFKSNIEKIIRGETDS